MPDRNDDLINEARALFRQIQAGNEEISFGAPIGRTGAWGAQAVYATEEPKISADRIRRILQAADADMAALDPEGKKTAAEMEAELGAAVKANYLQSAHTLFEMLKTDPMRTPDDVVDRIPYYLRHAGVDEAALDPEGRKSAREMEHELAAMGKALHISRAQQQYLWIRDGIADPENGPADLHRYLRRAEADLTAADPEGKRTAAQIEEDIRAGGKLWYVNEARKNFEFLQREDAVVTDEFLEGIRADLAQGGVGVEGLDRTGTKNRAQMEEEWTHAVRDYSIRDARRNFKHMLEGTRDADDAMVDIMADFKRSDIGAEVLDENGVIQRRQMENMLHKLHRDMRDPNKPNPLDSGGLAGLDPGMQRALAQFETSKSWETGGEPASIPFPVSKGSGRGAA